MAVLKDLIVHGGSRFLGDLYFNFLKAKDIAADTAYFKKLTAVEGTIDDLTSTNLTTKNATVTALLDVQGDMHTNSWSNASIATIDGSFYINPTSSSADGSDVSASNYTPTGSITYNNGNYTQFTVTGTFNTSQLSLDNATNVAWPANSYVIITGDVRVGNEWYPLGTIRGKLSSQLAANTSSKTITVVPIGTQVITGEVGNTSLTDGHGLKPQTLEAIRLASNGSMSGLKMRKIKVSMTSYGGTNQKPIGIFMTAMGSNKKTFLDIYGGVNDTTSAVGGGLAKPTVRIGNLEGMPTISNVTPHGWGIYTNNGFFTGTVVAERGKIGNWNIGTDANKSLYTNTFNADGGVYVSPSYSGVLSIAGSSSKNWAFAAGKNFGVTTDGTLYANNAEVSGRIVVSGNNSNVYTKTETNNAIVSESQKYITAIGNDGIKVHPYNSNTGQADEKHYTKIDSNGMEVVGDYTNDGVLVEKVSLASFGHNSRIGAERGPHTKIDDSGVKFNNSLTTYGYVSYQYSRRDAKVEQGFVLPSGSQQGVPVEVDFQCGFWSIDNLIVKVVYKDHAGKDVSTQISKPLVEGQGREQEYSFTLQIDDDVLSPFTLKVRWDGYIYSDHMPYLNPSFTVTELKHSAAVVSTSLILDGVESVAPPHFSFGQDNAPNGKYAYTIGNNLQADGDYQLAVGQYNEVDNDALFIIGNGADGNNRSNLFVVDGEGNLKIKNGFQIKDGEQALATFQNDKIILGDNSDEYLGTYMILDSANGVNMHRGTSVFHIDNDGMYWAPYWDERVFSVDRGGINFNPGIAFQGFRVSMYDSKGQSDDPNMILAPTSKVNLYSYAAVAEKGSFAMGSDGALTNPTTGNITQVQTLATGQHSFAQGTMVQATGNYSHAEGDSSKAIGNASHSQNSSTIAQGMSQTAIGKFNIAQGTADSIANSDYAFIIGNGTANTGRSNALTVDWSGNVNIASGAKYKINGTALAASDVGAVPTTRKVNNKALSSDISLSASDVGAVPTTRKVNNKALSSDISLTASDVGAVSDVQLNGTSLKSGTVANLLTSSLIDIFYPVGSYYETSDTTFDPNTAWGGTWKLETEGMVHVSAGTNYEVNHAADNNGAGAKDGGNTTSATGNHTLTINEMPSHTHTQNSHSHKLGSSVVRYINKTAIVAKGTNYKFFSEDSNLYTDGATAVNQNTGGGGAHNHGNVSTMQPYINVYRWHRTA